MKGAIIMAAVLVVTGCVQAEIVPGPDGQPAVLIDCSDSWSDGDCYREAAKHCPSGYELLPPPTVTSYTPRTFIFVRCTGVVKAKK